MSKRNRDKGRLAPFVPVTKDTMKTEAWKALSHGARSLYIALKGRYNSRLQNAVYISIRCAHKELGAFSHVDNVGRWFRELQYYGFIVMESGPCLGVEGKGKAPHYRLTEEWHLGKPPTRDYLNWDGELFHEQKPPSYYNGSRQRKFVSREKQNPVPPVRYTAYRPSGTLQNGTGPKSLETVPPVPDIQLRGVVPPVQDITSLTTPCPASVLPDAAVVFQSPAVRPDAKAVADYIAAWTAPSITELPWSDYWQRVYLEEVGIVPADCGADDLSIPAYLDRRAHA